MSTGILKLIACAAMVIDHVGLLFFPQAGIFRIIGRLALPIYAFLIAVGVRRTRSAPRYLLRLAVLAVLSQAPFALAFFGGSMWTSLNIFVTLWLGAVAALFFRLPRSRFWLSAIGAALCALLAELLHTDYGAGGVLLIVAFALAGESKWRCLVAVAGAFAMSPFYAVPQAWAALAAVPLWFYNGKLGYNKKNRLLQWAFYLFYPLYLLLLWALRLLLA